MKRQKSCGPRLGKLVHQLPGVVTFAYDLRFRRVIALWKGIVEEIHFGGSIMPLAIIEHLDLKKPSFRPSKWPRKLNLLKIVNCQNCQKTILSQSEKVGGHQYPPGSGCYLNFILISSYLISPTPCIVLGFPIKFVPSRTHQVWFPLTMDLDSSLCLQGHTKWVGDFSTIVGVYEDGNIFGTDVGDKSLILG
jgi:hypothetical protein